MARSRTPLRIPFVAEVSAAIKSIRGLDKEIDGLDASARKAQESFKQAGDATDQAFEGAQDSVDAAEKAMRSLGIKSEQVANNQIAHLRQSFAQLKNSGAASTKEIARAYENMQNRIQRINAQIGREGKRTFQKLAQDASAQLRKIGDGLTSAGSALSMRVTAPIALGFGTALRAAGNFEHQMQGVRALLSDVSDKDFAKLNEAAREMGRAAGYGASETAAAMEVLASQGLNTEQILGGALEATANAAAAGGSSIEDAATLMTQASNTFGIEAGKMGTVANRVVGLMDVSRFGVQDFSLALSQGGLAAKQAKLSLEEFAAVVAISGKYFDSGSDAGTSFKTFISSLAKDTDAAKEAMERIGFSAFDAAGNMVSMEEIVRRLQRGLAGLSDQAKSQVLTDIFGSDAGRIAFALATEGVEGYGRALSAVFKGDAARAAETRMKGFNGQMKQLRNALEDLAIAFAKTGILEMITGIVKAVTGWIESMAEASPGTLKLIAAIALLAAVVGPVLLVLGQMAIGLALLSTAAAGVGVALGGITLAGLAMAAGIGIALGAVVALVWIYRDQIINAVGDVIRWIRENAASIGKYLLLMVSPITYLIWKFREEIYETIKPVVDLFAWAGKAIYDHFSAPFVRLGRAIQVFFNAWRLEGWSFVGFWRGIGAALYIVLIEPWADWYASVKKYCDWAIKAGKWVAQSLGFNTGGGSSSEYSDPRYATGGIVRGPGTGTSDSIRAWLSNGEGVINARAVRHYGERTIGMLNNLSWSPAQAMVPAMAAAGGRNNGLTPVTINLGADAVSLFGDEPNVLKLLNSQARRKAARRTGRPPEW